MSELAAKRTRGLGARVLDLGIARIGALVARSIMFVVFARALDTSVYGHVAVMLAVSNLFLVLLDFGLPMFLLRAGATGAAGAEQAMTGLVVARGLAVLPVLVLYTGTLYVVVGPTLSLSLALAVGVYAFSFQLAQTIFVFQRGNRRTSLEGITTGIVSLLDIALTVGWYALGMSDPLGLFWILAAIRVLAVLAVTAQAVGALRESFDRSATREFVRANRRTLAPYLVLGLAQFAIAQLGTVILQVVASSAEVGVYFGCNRIAWIAYLPTELLLAAAMPRFASAASRVRFREVLVGVQRPCTTWTIALIAATYAEPSFMAHTMLGSTDDGVITLFALMMGATAFAWLPPYALPLAMEADARPVVRVYVATAVISLIAHAVLVPRYGATGAATSMLFAYAALKLLIVPLARERGVLVFDGKQMLLPLVMSGTWFAVVRLFSPAVLPSLAVLGILTAALALWQLRSTASIIERE